MRKGNLFRAGTRWYTTSVETLYRTLDAGLCHGKPVAAGVGTVVEVLQSDVESIKSDLDAALCQAEIDGAPAWGWLRVGWLEPAYAHPTLFATDHPTLF
jgi:hypothetical protein